ncbi:ferritin-like-domain-containing protein [Phanerochaete sordida]|uniref:Ferritin-like-domain-containing protein n=1 Tax=Phanerochaete sordida TaxID=48140 RepID=A0A9P3GSB2_9APHY|nr:ferritin-like-domain-containing protein [Phanerochaete sordida]
MPAKFALHGPVTKNPGDFVTLPGSAFHVPVKGPPIGGPESWTKNDIIEHVKTGMKIELSTMPIYFCALNSIHHDNGGWGTKARFNILAIAEQEMLHLALAGNMLASLGGSQPLYNHKFVPSYPSSILFDNVDMVLRPADKENLECFLKLEAPYMPSESDLLDMHHQAKANNVAPTYMSIGQFYKELERGIQAVAQKDPDLFGGDVYHQFRGADFFDSNMTVITDKDSALKALQTIVDQGEGSLGIPESHYALFVELYQMRMNWKCINYIDEPSTEKYWENGNMVAFFLSLAVNASYCYLLQAIDRFREEDLDSVSQTQLLRQIRRIMVAILSPAMHALAGQEITPGRFAAPCFEFYPPYSEDCLTPSALFNALSALLEMALGVAEDEAVKDEISKIVFSMSDLGPA